MVVRSKPTASILVPPSALSDQDGVLVHQPLDAVRECGAIVFLQHMSRRVMRDMHDSAMNLPVVMEDDTQAHEIHWVIKGKTQSTSTR